MVDEASSVSQQTAAEASNVSAASEEQTASLSEASDNVERLSRLADQLHDQVSDFEIRAGDEELGDEETAGPDEPPASAPDEAPASVPDEAPASIDDAVAAAADGGFDFSGAPADATRRD